MSVRAIASILSLLTLAGCSGSAKSSGGDPQAVRPAQNSQVVARVGDHAFTLDEVDKEALKIEAGSFGSLKLAQAMYEARRQVLDSMIGAYLVQSEARARSLDEGELLRREVTDTIKPVTDADATAWYSANRDRVGGATLEQVRSQIKAFLMQQQSEDARQALIGRLKQKTAVQILLEPPRTDVTVAADDPARGPSGAPVEIVEFSDFQCPFCARATPTIDRIMADYGDRVRLVYRDYPLPNHSNARAAAEAAQCANDQGKFWPYHDVLFANQSRLAVDQLKQYSTDLALNTPQFVACLDGGKYRDEVEQDLKEGGTFGVSATPTFFINGRMLAGALPYEAFRRIIDEELAAKGSATPAR